LILIGSRFTDIKSMDLGVRYFGRGRQAGGLFPALKGGGGATLFLIGGRFTDVKSIR